MRRRVAITITKVVSVVLIIMDEDSETHRLFSIMILVSWCKSRVE